MMNEAYLKLSGFVVSISCLDLLRKCIIYAYTYNKGISRIGTLYLIESSSPFEITLLVLKAIASPGLTIGVKEGTQA